MPQRAIPLRDQAAVHDEWVLARLDRLLPRLMERSGIDCWIVAGREYNEDPVLRTMLPASWLGARRRTILVFTQYGKARVAVARYPVGELFAGIWSPEANPDQLGCLADYLVEQNPQQIALDTSSVFALADGLSASERAALLGALPADIAGRVVGGDALAIGWLETRTPLELASYPEVCSAAHDLLNRALSPEVITPRSTTTADVVWWLRQQTADAGYASWFHPTVTVQRLTPIDLDLPGGDIEIAPGDLVHIDFGISYLGLHTDQQRHGYVLRPGESDPPAGLRIALATGNHAQDLLLSGFAAGRTGNEILGAARAAFEDSGIDGAVYSHPIGLHGHGAGPTIGLWDQQEGVPGPGDYPVYPGTAYAIELSVAVAIPEWEGATARIMLEENAVFDGNCLTFLDGRQTEFLLI